MSLKNKRMFCFNSVRFFAKYSSLMANGQNMLSQRFKHQFLLLF
jgi:hypothetical protein